MEISSDLTEQQRAEMFREFQSQHLRRQTAAIETIRTILLVWVILTVIGAALLLTAAARGY